MNTTSYIAILLLLTTSWTYAVESPSTPVPQPPKTTRVAVISSSGTGDLGAALIAELSSISSIELLERDEMERVIMEKQLISLLSQDDYHQIGQLLDADGLVIIRNEKIEEKDTRLARLVAVGPGVVIAGLVIPHEVQSPLVQAQLISQRFSSGFSKLRLSNIEDATRLSLLGLRFELDTPQARRVERMLNTLLANRLMGIEGVFVLERWELQEAAWEKGLKTEETERFWCGSYLFDGRIVEQKTSIKIEGRLRRNADAPPVWVECSGSTTNIATLVDTLTEKLIACFEKKAVLDRWSAEEEANAYTILGQTALDGHLPRESIDAFESALALGYKGRLGRKALVKAYTLMAYPKQLEFANFEYIKHFLQTDDMGASVYAVTMAQQVLADYLAMPEDSLVPEPEGLRDPKLHIGEMMFTALRVLRAAYEDGYHREDPEALARLRRLVRANFRSNKKVNMRDEHQIYAPFWTDTPEDTLRTYRSLLQPDTARDRKSCFRAFLYYTCKDFRRPTLDGNVSTIGRASRVNPWWLIAWDPRDEERLPDLWRGFVEEYLNATNLQEISDGLMLKYRSLGSRESRLKMLPEVSTFLWEHRAKLCKQDEPPYLDTFAGVIRDFWDENAPDKVKTIHYPFCAYVMQHAEDLRGMASLELIAKDADLIWTEDQARELYVILEQRKTGSTKARDDLARQQEKLCLEFPSLRPPPLHSNHQKLVVKRFLKSPISAELPVVFAEGRVWFAERGTCRLHSIDPVSSEDRLITWPDKLKGKRFSYSCSSLDITSDHIFLVEHTLVWKYDRKGLSWTQIEVPTANYRGRFINGFLYLVFNIRTPIPGGLSGHGLLRVDPRDGSTKILVSSRRSPRVSSLDGTDFGLPYDIFPGRDGRLSFPVGVGGGFPSFRSVYEFREGDSAWHKILTSSPKGKEEIASWRKYMKQLGSQVTVCDSGALFFGKYEMKRMLYLGHGEKNIRNLIVSPDLAREDDDAVWNYPANPTLEGELSATMRSGNLWILRQDRKLEKAGSVSSARKRYFTGSNHVIYAFEKGKIDFIDVTLLFEYEEPSSSAIASSVVAYAPKSHFKRSKALMNNSKFVFDT